MAIKYIFEIDDVEVEDPQGWDDMSLEINRDEEWHGVFFEAATSTLGFYGRGADMLRDKKINQGLAATAKLKISAVCGQEVDVLEASLDFGTYNEQCGQTCIVQIGMERTGCTMTFRNRYEQKIDLSKNTASDNATVLQQYPGLNFEMDMPAQELDARVEGYVADEGDIGDYQAIDPDGLPTRVTDIRPSYVNEKFNSINSGELQPAVAVTQMAELNDVISPFLLFDDNIDCFGDQVFNYEFRFKGRYRINCDQGDSASYLAIAYFDGVGVWDGTPGAQLIEAFEIYNNDFYPANTVIEFDHTFTGTVNLIQGRGVYAYLNIGGNPTDPTPTYNWEFDKETHGLIYINKACPPTKATVSLVNEVGSRITENITDGCMRMKSDYFGRTDSMPYESAEDGCGALRVLTSGLRLRNALNPVHFMSFRDYFMGLRGIDNIGIGVEPDTVIGMGREWLRVEPAEYFYQDQEVLRLPHIPDAHFILDPAKGAAIVKIGYQRWEVERVNGLDEFNSNKEFRTGLSTINNTVDATSTFVAGGYPIEITRQQSFAISGGADTTYDNEDFVICVERDPYGFHAEQGNIVDAANFYSPSTAYNWRIRPYYNLMRWWKSLAQTYRNLGSSLSKLFFSAGEGNLLATGKMSDDCELANSAYAENTNLQIGNFIDPNYPIFKPDRITFTYAFSLSDYLKVKSSPYGYVSVQCGNGEFMKAYVISIKYRPSQGLADFNLIFKW